MKNPLTDNLRCLSPLRARRGKVERTRLGSLLDYPERCHRSAPLENSTCLARTRRQECLRYPAKNIRKRERVRVRVRHDCIDALKAMPSASQRRHRRNEDLKPCKDSAPSQWTLRE